MHRNNHYDTVLIYSLSFCHILEACTRMGKELKEEKQRRRSLQRLFLLKYEKRAKRGKIGFLRTLFGDVAVFSMLEILINGNKYDDTRANQSKNDIKVDGFAIGEQDITQDSPQKDNTNDLTIG